MAAIHEIKTHIQSVNDTAKITKAMQLVSAVKMRKIEGSYAQAQDYVAALREIISAVAKNNLSISDNKLLNVKASSEKKALIVLIATSRGFVGAQLSKLTESLVNLTADLKNKGVGYEVTSVKAKGLKISNRAGIQPEMHFADDFEGELGDKLTALRSNVIDSFASGKYQEVYLVYTKFVSSWMQIPVVDKFLPFNLGEEIKQQDGKEAAGAKKTAVTKVQAETSHQTGTNANPFKFEPSSAAVANRAIEEYLEMALYNAILSATASEYSARMMVMQKATDNSVELVGGLQLEYNKARQSEITQQIQEITNSQLNL